MMAARVPLAPRRRGCEVAGCGARAAAERDAARRRLVSLAETIRNGDRIAALLDELQKMDGRQAETSNWSIASAPATAIGCG